MAIVEKVELSRSEWNPNIISNEILNEQIQSIYLSNSKQVFQNLYKNYEIQDDQDDLENNLNQTYSIPPKAIKNQLGIQRKRAINILEMKNVRNRSLEIWNRDNMAYDQPISWDWEVDHFKDWGKEAVEGFEELGNQTLSLLRNLGDNLMADLFSKPKTKKTNQNPGPMENFLRKYLTNSAINEDGVVDLFDLRIFYEHLGRLQQPYSDATVSDSGVHVENVYWVENSQSNDLTDYIEGFKNENGPTIKPRWKPGPSKWLPDGDNSDYTLNPLSGLGTIPDKIKKPNRISPFELLQNYGQDFMKHKFDAFFAWNFIEGENLLEELYDVSWLTQYEKYILNKRGFAVRIGEISIPAIINEDYSISFTETEIRKIKSIKSINNQSSFTFRLDKNLIWLDKLNEFAGHKNGVDETFITKENMHPYVSSFHQTETVMDWRNVLKTVAKSWPTKSNGIKYNIKDSELCLIVHMSQLSNFIDLNNQHKYLPYFIFENVRILGTSDNILYERGDGGTQEITVNFIFKRCHQIMPKVQPIIKDKEDNYIYDLQFTMKHNSNSNPYSSFTSNGKTKFGFHQINTDILFQWTKNNIKRVKTTIDRATIL